MNTFKTAGLMRWFGAAAVATSAAVFLLQGIANIDLELRNWVYLGLMAIMAGCGFASSKLLQDAKSTRLFFGLAAFLVPIQFAQLGGMLHELSVNQLASGSMLFWLVLATGVLALPIAYAAMAILDRPNKHLLTAGLVTLCVALLLPYRASPVGFAILAAIGFSTLYIQHAVLGRGPASLENKGLRFLLLVPLVIAGVRMSLHIDSVAGFSAMGALAAVAITRLATNQAWLRAIGALTGMLSWLVYAVEMLPGTTSGTWALTIIFLPMTLWLLHVASLPTVNSKGRQPRLYRGAASLLFMLSAASVLLADGGTASTALLQMVALAHGAAALAWGIIYNHREPTLTGAAISLLTLGHMLVSAFGSVEVSTWILLGVAGVTLVLGASILEKHGRRVAAKTKQTWRMVSHWA